MAPPEGSTQQREGSDAPAAEPPAYPAGSVRALLATDRVTPATRQALQTRLATPAVRSPRFFDAACFATLRAVCARLLAQPDDGAADRIDVAGALDTRLADGVSDGWRHDTLPPDAETYRRGLQAVSASAEARFGAAFTALAAVQQDEVLFAVQHGEVTGDAGVEPGTLAWQGLDAARFFEVLLASAAEAFYAHPLAMEEIGCVAMADAGGWHAIGLDRLDPHEPRPWRA